MKSYSQIWPKFEDTLKSNGKNTWFIGHLAERCQAACYVFKTQRVYKHSHKLKFYKIIGVFVIDVCSKVTRKGKICSRLLELQKVVAPNAKSSSKVAENNLKSL